MMVARGSAPDAGEPRPQPERAIQATTIVAVIAVAAVAAFVSYRHMRGVALQQGEDELTATVIPFSVDGLIVAASMSMLRDRRAGRPRSLLSYVLLGLGACASLAANVMHAEPTLAARIIAGWPPLALLGSYELLMRQIDAGRRGVRVTENAVLTVPAQRDGGCALAGVTIPHDAALEGQRVRDDRQIARPEAEVPGALEGQRRPGTRGLASDGTGGDRGSVASPEADVPGAEEPDRAPVGAMTIEQRSGGGSDVSGGDVSGGEVSGALPSMARFTPPAPQAPGMQAPSPELRSPEVQVPVPVPVPETTLSDVIPDVTIPNGVKPPERGTSGTENDSDPVSVSPVPGVAPIAGPAAELAGQPVSEVAGGRARVMPPPQAARNPPLDTAGKRDAIVNALETTSGSVSKAVALLATQGITVSRSWVYQVRKEIQRESGRLDPLTAVPAAGSGSRN